MIQYIETYIYKVTHIFLNKKSIDTAAKIKISWIARYTTGLLFQILEKKKKWKSHTTWSEGQLVLVPLQTSAISHDPTGPLQTAPELFKTRSYNKINIINSNLETVHWSEQHAFPSSQTSFPSTIKFPQHFGGSDDFTSCIASVNDSRRSYNNANTPKEGSLQTMHPRRIGEWNRWKLKRCGCLIALNRSLESWRTQRMYNFHLSVLNIIFNTWHCMIDIYIYTCAYVKGSIYVEIGIKCIIRL